MNKRFLSALAVPAALAAITPAITWAEPVDALYEQGQHDLPAGWKPLARSETAALFLHNDVRTAEGGKLTVWTHQELAVPGYFEKDKTYLSARERMLVDCKGGRTGISEWVAYAGRFATGGMIGKEQRDKEMGDAVPDSPEAKLLAVVCAAKTVPPRPHSRPAAKKVQAAAAAPAAASTPAPAKKP